ncbi:ABC transporter substrate-binding protein [Litchfieldia alkalitelluris]|uniref:ABC transporter substrate-binding protein n=1 Tax=Litchfieldia alkalitelluris TaxID=304268 RepID=UPI000997E1E3|nr:extracellular solute-binding protein [Litchfieldia alkalitelluris]
MLRKFGIQKILLVFVSVMLFIGVVGCSKDTSTDSNGKTKLTIWLWPGMGIEDQIKQYAEENGIEVDIQLSEFADVHNNLTTALAAGSGAPDISAVEVKGIDKMKGNPEHFHNLLDLGADDVKGDYLDWKWRQALTADGKHLLGLPTDIGPQAMAYRLDIFEQAGLPTDREEVANLIKTWDDFIRVGEEIKAKTGKAMIDSPNGAYSVMEGQGSEKYFDKDGNVIVQDNPQIKKAYDFAVQLIEKDLTSGFEQWSAEWGTGMTNGDFATLLAPAWMMTFMKENAPDAAGIWDITLLPEGSGNWGGSFLTIPKESKNAEEAYKLIKWLLSPEQQLATFKTAGNFPSTPGIYDSEEIQSFTSDYFNNAPVGKIYAEAAKQVKPIIEGPESIQIEGYIGDAITRVKDGQAEPQASWDQAMEQIERELSR